MKLAFHDTDTDTDTDSPNTATILLPCEDPRWRGCPCRIPRRQHRHGLPGEEIARIGPVGRVGVGVGVVECELELTKWKVKPGQSACRY